MSDCIQDRMGGSDCIQDPPAVCGLVNLTPHAIVVRHAGGDLVLPPSGQVARVSSVSAPAGHVEHNVLVDGLAVLGASIPCVRLAWGEVEGLPAPDGRSTFVVSALVLGRCGGRDDVVAPATGPTDGAIRDDGGRIIAVTKLVRA